MYGNSGLTGAGSGILMCTIALLCGQTSVEMTADSRFGVRVIRLAATSVIALGLIWGFAFTTLDAPAFIGIALAAGWVLMPALLMVSLRWPVARYGLALPSTLVGFGLVAICLTALPPDWGAARIGWLMTNAGVLMGGALGLWFWFRLAPVPRFLDDPFGPGRWVLVAVHIALIVIGLALIGLSALAQT